LTLLVATTSRDKLGEILTFLSGLPIDLRTLAELPPIDPPEETGATFEENARQKALFYASRTGLPTVAEDSGLEIDALGGAPGVYSARFGGSDLSYPERFARIEAQLVGVPPSNRTARFVCAVALADKGHVVFEARGTVEGLIAPEPRGTGGFGYDPIFFYPPFNCTLAEAGDHKALVSHRAKAFQELRAFLGAGAPIPARDQNRMGTGDQRRS
jgi:XTP/dITP diphosphohydrolase